MSQVVEERGRDGRAPVLNGALLMTVGLGHDIDPTSTLYGPMQKSMRKSAWSQIYLLPSEKSNPRALKMKEECPDLPIQVLPPLAPDVEEDPDRCFAYYEQFLQNLIGNGWRPDRITVDYTRGTKTMSAAILLAAASHGVRALRYVSGERGEGNIVIGGTEVVRDFPAAFVMARRELALALDLLKRHHFAGAEATMPSPRDLPQLYPEALHAEASGVRWLARFWGAWDRLDYEAASKLLRSIPDSWPKRLTRFAPRDGHMDAVRRLAKPLGKMTFEEKADGVWLRAGDLLANAKRRVALGELEDAFLRVYRVLELIGQARLFEYSLDSEDLDSHDARVDAWLQYLKKKNETLHPKKGKISIAREQVARLLKHLNDPLGRTLLDAAETGALQAKLRNNSLLIHGFEAKVTSGQKAELSASIKLVESILTETLPPELRDLVANSRFPF